jgi:hypothetical protein
MLVVGSGAEQDIIMGITNSSGRESQTQDSSGAFAKPKLGVSSQQSGGARDEISLEACGTRPGWEELRRNQSSQCMNVDSAAGACAYHSKLQLLISINFIKTRIHFTIYARGVRSAAGLLRRC